MVSLVDRAHKNCEERPFQIDGELSGMIAYAGWEERYKVTLDGEDVSGWVFFADDEEGLCYCFVELPIGSPCQSGIVPHALDDCGAMPAFTKRRGKVVIEYAPIEWSLGMPQFTKEQYLARAGKEYDPAIHSLT